MTSSTISTPSPGFRGIFIPVEILDMPDLSWLEKLLLSWIDALYCPDHGGCYASNEYLAEKLQVKDNTIAKSLTRLRQLELIDDVSFDGRTRVIRSLVARYVEKVQSKAALDKNPRGVGFLSNPTLDENPKGGTPLHIGDNKDDNKDYNSLPSNASRLGLSAAKAAAAIAAGEEVDSLSSPKKESKGQDEEEPPFSPQVRELGATMIDLLQSANPVYRSPANKTPFLKQVRLLLERDKQQVALILEVFEWAANDTEERGTFKGWQSVLCSKNPAESFRKFFAKIHSQMVSRPKRKFAPASDDRAALEAIRSMRATSI